VVVCERKRKKITAGFYSLQLAHPFYCKCNAFNHEIWKQMLENPGGIALHYYNFTGKKGLYNFLCKSTIEGWQK